MTAGCQSGFSIEDAELLGNRKALTITLYTLVEDSTTEDDIKIVGEELSKITESLYTTKLILVGLKKDAYEAKIAELFVAYDKTVAKQKEDESIQKSLDKASKEQAKKDKAAGLTQAPTKRPTEPPKTTELYTERVIYPEVAKDQLDIFLITSPGMFYGLATGNFAFSPIEGFLTTPECRLTGMDDELNTKAKVLKEYLFPSVMMAGQFGDKTLAIPTNKAIGTASYIAVNRRLVDEYNAVVEEHNKLAEEHNKAIDDAAKAAAEDTGETGEVAAEPAPAVEEAVKMEKMAKLDLNKVKEYQHLTAYLEWVKEMYPGEVALMEGPFLALKNYDPLFPEMPDFALVANAPKVPVYTPVQPATETAAATTPESPATEKENDETIDPDAPTTITPTTTRNNPAPPSPVLAIPKPSISNKYYSAGAVLNNAALNQEYREKGLFETAPIPADKERAAFIFQGTLEDMVTKRDREKDENGENIYEYIMYGNPMATKENLQSSMYAISVSSKIPTMRCMEIITLLNTNKKFKNTFQYGKEGEHFIYNDNGEIEVISDGYKINMDYTGNHFIADLEKGSNHNKWQLAQEHNINVINSVFLQLYIDLTKLPPADQDAIPVINELSQQVNQVLLSGSYLDEYPDLDSYVEYISVLFEEAGDMQLLKAIKEQTNPPEE